MEVKRHLSLTSALAGAKFLAQAPSHPGKSVLDITQKAVPYRRSESFGEELPYAFCKYNHDPRSLGTTPTELLQLLGDCSMELNILM